MSHIEDTSTTNTESNGLKEGSARKQVRPAFDVEAIDNLLVFWPDKLVDLSHLASPQDGKEKDATTLIVGHVIHGHPQEVAVVVVGTARAYGVDEVPSKISSKGLSVVGCLSDALIDQASSTFPDCRIWVSALPPSKSCELPSIVFVRFSHQEPGNGHSSLVLSPCAISLISYSVPNSRMLQYFALESLRLGPVSGMKLVCTASALLVPDAQLADFSRLMAAKSAPSMLQNKFLQLLLLDPVHWRSLRSVEPEQSRMSRGTALRRSIELINRLQAQQELLFRSSDSNGAVHKSNSDESGFGAWPQLIAKLGDSVTTVALAVQRALRHPLYTPKHNAVLIDGVARHPISRDPTQSPLRLTSISACARQLDVRISQLVIAPRLASRLRYLRKQQKLPIDEIAAPYIGLWNAVWLIANDLILGYAASVLLLEYRAQLAHLGRVLVERYLHDWVLWLLSWLENWPAGLKLNTELSLFFSDAYSSLTSAWHTQGLVHVLPRLESVVFMTAIVGRWMGVTMILCMLQDLIAVCTLHITMFYTLSFRTLRAFVFVLSALFDVFRGKKRNALRGGRLDDASYELDQLLLGTLLFTLVAFLFPTVYVYYLAFGLVRLAVVGFEVGVVETGLGLLNHLPLFAVMLRFKDPHRLPAGVWLQEVGIGKVGKTGTQVLQTGRFRLRSRPLAIGDIFEGYGQHVGGLVELPSMILRCILSRPLRSSPSSSS